MEHACLSVLNDDSKNNQSTSFSCKIQFVGAAQAQKANKQDIDMSNSLAGVGKQKREDLEVVIKHAKVDLFAKVKFIYDPKVDLAVGGKIYADHKRKCKDQIGGQGLSTEGHDTHMESIWTMAMTKHMQKNALAQKRSAVCTVMQNKFGGEWVPEFGSREVICLCN